MTDDDSAGHGRALGRSRPGWGGPGRAGKSSYWFASMTEGSQGRHTPVLRTGVLLVAICDIT